MLSTRCTRCVSCSAHFTRLLEVLTFLTSLSSKSKKVQNVDPQTTHLPTSLTIRTYAIIFPWHFTTFLYQTKCSVLIRLGSAGILESVEDSLLDWTHWPAEAECDFLELGFSFTLFTAGVRQWQNRLKPTCDTRSLYCRSSDETHLQDFGSVTSNSKSNICPGHKT